MNKKYVILAVISVIILTIGGIALFKLKGITGSTTTSTINSEATSYTVVSSDNGETSVIGNDGITIATTVDGDEIQINEDGTIEISSPSGDKVSLTSDKVNVVSVKNDTTNVTTTDSQKSVEGTVSNATATISLNGDTVNISGTGAIFNEGTLKIAAAGTYVFSGTLNNGRIVVDAKDANVTIVLNGVNISCSNSSPIYVYEAKNAVITLVDGTINTVTDGSQYTFTDQYSSSEDEEPNATIFSKSDLDINGTGKLVVNAKYNNGITSKDDLEIVNATIEVNANNNGINGKDSNIIENANINVVSNGDAIRATNDTDATKGYIKIVNSNININSQQDAIQAETSVEIIGGSYNIQTLGGSSNNKNLGENSAKAIKATTSIILVGGTYNIDSADDAIHANTNVNIAEGTYNIKTGDDAVHADSSITISDAKINVSTSYEGLEGFDINIHSGDLDIVANDDAINVCGGNDNSGATNEVEQPRFSASSGGTLTIKGGDIYLNSNGDSLDSNGSIVMTGGKVIVDGTTGNGNGAIDYDKTFNISGGTVLAIGASGMAQAPSTTSTQYSVSIGLTAIQAAGTKIVIKDSSGAEVINHTSAKTFSSIVLSSPLLTNGESYKVYLNDVENTSFTISSIVTTVGNVGMGGGRGGMMPGGEGTMPTDGTRPVRGQKPTTVTE